MLEAVALGKTFQRRPWRRCDFEVRGISIHVHPGEAVGLVGPSGSGKSTVARMLALLTRPTHGVVRLDGRALAWTNPRRLRDYRRNIQMIFQDPHLALDPKKTIAWTLREPLLAHGIARSRSAADAGIEALLAETGLSGEIRNRRPGEISGGQAQRVVIARALSLSPRYLIADEATSMLDLSVQAMVLNLLKGLMRRRNLGVVVISHDPALVKAFCTRSYRLGEGRLLPEAAPHIQTTAQISNQRPHNDPIKEPWNDPHTALAHYPHLPISR
jgi:ABC-type glutathione transport system ATPase component